MQNFSFQVRDVILKVSIYLNRAKITRRVKLMVLLNRIYKIATKKKSNDSWLVYHMRKYFLNHL